jgi:hypothetical protein
MLILGLTGECSRVSLVAPGLYVAIPVEKITVPKKISELESFHNILETLIRTIVSVYSDNY